MRLRRVCGILIAICLLAGLGCGTDKSSNPGDGDAESFSVEAESFTGHYNVDGSMIIQQAYCSNASGQHVAIGMDREGEWIALAVSVPKAGLYEVALRYSAPTDSVIVVKITAGDCGGQEQPEFTLDQGAGVG